MKKFLSLVLALAMTMSLVTVSAGAKDFTDNSKIEYKEAVDVVSAAKIVDGYEDGSFNPSNTLTRGAAAKIICNLILGPTTAGALRADTAPYSDVPTSNTFAGYIAYCQKEKIISGYADGTFRPAATLTGYAFMKMLLGALGYDSDIEGYTGSNWSIAVGKRALGIELDDGNDNFVGVNAVTREEACLYAFNTLKATMVEYKDNSKVTVGDITIANKSTATEVERTSGKDYTGYNESSDHKDSCGTQQFCEKYFSKLKAEDDTDKFGAPATKWIYDSNTVGTYANDVDDTYTVKDSDKTLKELLTDSDYMNLDSDDVLDDAVVYFNGEKLGKYKDLAGNAKIAGKGDVIDTYEDNNNDVDTIVVRSYTYAKIDSVDKDLSNTLKNKGASVEISLVKIDGKDLGNADYYDDHNDDEKVLNGFNAAEYTEGTVLAVALGKDDAIVGSYVVKSVTGTPSAAKAVTTYAYDGANGYQGSGNGVKDGSITVDGTKYNYAAQFTGLTSGEEVKFDKEYVVYLTAEGYALAVDGEATASLDDVYYVTGGYEDTSKGSTSYYLQAVSVSDGTELEAKLDKDYYDGSDNSTYTDEIVDKLKNKDGKFQDSFKGIYELEKDGSVYHATQWTKNSKYTLIADTLSHDVTSSSTVIRMDNSKKAYISDSTFFVGVEDQSSYIDITTATGMMTVEKGTIKNPVHAYVIADDNDAKFVVYAADKLNGAANKDDIVYLDDDCDTRVSSSAYEGTLWFMKDLSDKDVSIDDDGKTKQGFYKYSIDSKGVYKLETANGLSDGEVSDNADGYAKDVVFETGKSTSLTSAAASTSVDATSYDNKVAFVGTSMKNATVIDTRSSSDRSKDAYSNEINTTSKLVSALDKGLVVADVYVDDGDIIFVAVKVCENASTSGSSSDKDTVASFKSLSMTKGDSKVTLTAALDKAASSKMTLTGIKVEQQMVGGAWSEIGTYSITVDAKANTGSVDINGLADGYYRLTYGNYSTFATLK